MDHLPIFINLRKKPALVVGGGDVALRKINLLLKAQAKVTCVSPHFCEGIKTLSSDSNVSLVNKYFEASVAEIITE